ncbi:Rap1a/Tai family immunity protein [Nordella sp. HKS 07]|uniref:Rap1a/Tai family immunity protein n=1 Tax=Nordella sp. HKS 07 TaxID=2712222 RepID=UPI00352C9931
MSKTSSQLFAALLLLGALSSPATASFESGNTQWTTSTASKNSAGYHQDTALCLSNKRGIADVLASERIGDFRACIPSQVTAGQLADVAIEYLGARTALGHYSADSGGASAFSEAFPCTQ